jgi:NAD(P)-dependent dehydrogenase (short-subunit alcohol dehydrogenase family)
VVVGGSSGLGRCIGIGLAQRGEQVAMFARRQQRLEQAAAEAGNGTRAIVCDVTDEASCASAIATAVEGLGGIDALVYCPAISPLAKLVDTDADTWRRIFDTNVVGAALITAAAIPHLEESSGTVVYLSSVVASHTPPWPGLGAYAASKAALDKLVEAWRGEHPELGFTRLTVGECAGGEGDAQTEMTAGWNLELAAELYPTWLGRSYMSGALIEMEELLDVLHTLVRRGKSLRIPSVTVTASPVPPAVLPDELQEAAADLRSDRDRGARGQST